MGLGPYPAVSLAAARTLAIDCRTHVAADRDPKAERDKDIGKTFRECARLYLEAMKANWTNDKTAWQWHDSLIKRCASLQNRPVSQIDTNDVLSVLKPVWSKTPETARRMRARMEAVLDFAKSQGWREGENPARWRGHLSNILPKLPKLVRGHHPAMPYPQVPAFVARLRTMDALAARALELLILTATRTKEVLHAPWSEFDFAEYLWTIPAARMKAKRDHRIPLTDQAISILRPLHEARTSDYVFEGQIKDRPLSLMSMEMLLRRMKVQGITVHGFRSTFRDWCGDETNVPREIAEAALAHQVGSDVELAYRRSDALEKRRILMDAWGKYCEGNSIENPKIAYD